jgi:formylmethanofuran dehydrogenase subunit E
MRFTTILVFLSLGLLLFGHDDPNEKPAVDRTAAIHGTAGPFAVAGYRMGDAALRELGTKRGSFDLQVTHYAPQEVQWSGIVDGLQAATGTSLGKLNLRLVNAPLGQMRSVVLDKKAGKSITLRLSESFVKANSNLTRRKLFIAGEAVADQPASEIFSMQVSAK